MMTNTPISVVANRSKKPGKWPLDDLASHFKGRIEGRYGNTAPLTDCCPIPVAYSLLCPARPRFRPVYTCTRVHPGYEEEGKASYGGSLL